MNSETPVAVLENDSGTLKSHIRRYESLKRTFNQFANDVQGFNEHLPGLKVEPPQGDGLAFRVPCMDRVFEYRFKAKTADSAGIVEVSELNLMKANEPKFRFGFSFLTSGELRGVKHHDYSSAPMIFDGHGSYTALFAPLKVIFGF
jgi:hypothetical protein